MLVNFAGNSEMESLDNIIKHSLANMNLARNLFQSKRSLSDIKVGNLNPNRAALKEALDKCRHQIKKSKRWNVLPSPICFEHAAMLSRQNKSYQTEIKICQLYISLVDECVSRRTFIKKRFERKALSLCQPFNARLHNIKHLNTTDGVDVRHM